MSAPPKPWEGAGINARSASLSFDSPFRLPVGAGGPKPNALRSSGNPSAMDASNNSGSKPPPLPPRPQAQRSTGGFMYGGTGYGTSGMYGGYSGMYGGGLGGYGMYGGGYGAYGGYGGYGMGMNRFGSPLNQSGTSSFVGQAEETSRAAFQSIESIVHAFGSVAMMLESTHFAMRNTFLAVLSMADHFSRLRAHLVSALGAFTLFKAIRYIFRKIRALLGFSQNQALEEELWESATTAVVSSSEGGDSKKPRSWPILLFFAVVLGTPLIIWKLLQSLLNDESNVKDWKTGEGDHVIARAEYDFDGEGEDELSFRAGDILRLAPKGKQPRIRGWLLGTVDGSSEGIVPANYVKILGRRRGKKESKDVKKGHQTESQSPQPEQRRTSQSNIDQEFDKIIEKTDEDCLLPSQNLLTEDSLNERTLVDDDLSDSDFPNFNEEHT